METIAMNNKEFLVNALIQNLKWSQSIIRSFSRETLQMLYNKLTDGEQVYKAKIQRLNTTYNMQMVIPFEIVDMLGIRYGDRFNIKINLFKKEVILSWNTKGKYKVQKNNLILLPAKLQLNGMLKAGDDAMITIEDGRLVLKSFSYLL